MDTLKATFEDERQHLEGRIKQLQSQLQQVQGTQHDDIIKLDQMSKSQRDSQRKAQYDLDEVKHEKEMLKRKLDAVSSYLYILVHTYNEYNAVEIWLCCGHCYACTEKQLHSLKISLRNRKCCVQMDRDSCTNNIMNVVIELCENS